MSRIVTVVGGCGPGRVCGAERMAWRTGQALTARGHDVTMLTDAEPPSDVVAADHATGEDTPDAVLAFDLAAPDPVVAGHDSARRHGVPFLLVPASDPQVWPDPDLGAALCRQADRLFVLTPAEHRAMIGYGVRPDRIVRLPQAPDLVGRAEPAALRARLGIDGRMVLFLGRKLVTKGYRTLLDAAPEVWRRHPRTTFVFVGPDGDPQAPAFFSARRDPRVVDLGMLADELKHSAVAACDVLCLPSAADVFPLAFVEAWTLGKPVVTGDFPGAADVVRHGVDGLVTRTTPAAVAQALTALLDDDQWRTSLGAAGAERARSTLTWRAVAATISSALPAVPTRKGTAP